METETDLKMMQTIGDDLCPLGSDRRNSQGSEGRPICRANGDGNCGGRRYSDDRGESGETLLKQAVY